MKAVVFHDIGDIRLEDVNEPAIREPLDAIVRVTAAAICGTDLHFVRGTVPGMKAGTILGHEAVGIVEEVGKGVRNLRRGDRVVVPSTIACGYCSYCRAGYYAQCDHANPGGPGAGTAFFGSPQSAGGFDGLQAELARIPFANIGLVKLPEEVTDDQAILISDIFPTGYFGADCADICHGHTVAVFGCGPVGQFAIASAMLMDAGRVIAVDRKADRLEMARWQGAETINFEKEDPVEAIKELTGGIGVDRVIDAVGVDAEPALAGPAKASAEQRDEQEQERDEVAPERHPEGENWMPGHAPSQALEWAVQSVCKAGQVSIIGVYPEKVKQFPIGAAFNKNLTIKGGNCNHRRYVPMLVDMVRMGRVDPTKILTQREAMGDVIEAYKAFDLREPGWIKVELFPQGTRMGESVGGAARRNPGEARRAEREVRGSVREEAKE